MLYSYTYPKQFFDNLLSIPERNEQNAFVSTVMPVQKYSHNTKV